MALIKRLEEKAQLCFDTKNYYEALQVYLTICPRLKAQKKYDALIDSLYGGAMKMIKVGEFASALNLAELFVDVLNESKTKVSEELLDSFETIYRGIPCVLPNETDSRIDRRSELLNAAFKWTQVTATTKNEAKYGSPALHKRAARIIMESGNFHDAKRHFLLSNDPASFADGLIELERSGACDQDADLVGAKAVLELLCYGKSANACQLLQLYAQNHPEFATAAPYKSVSMFSFCWLLLLCLQTRKTTAKETVLAHYSDLVAFFNSHLLRDPSLLACLDKIGQVYLGLKPPGGEGGFLGSLLKGFLGSSKTDEAKDSTLVDDTSADEWDAVISEADFLKAAQSVNVTIPTLSHSMSRASLSAPEEKKAKTEAPAPPVSATESEMDLD